jgi:hypothetical protein
MRRTLFVFIAVLLVGCGGSAVATATFVQTAVPAAGVASPTPWSAVAPARDVTTIPINQLTGADWTMMTFDQRGWVIGRATQHIHCPSTITSNDLVIAITQAASIPAAQSQKVIDLLAVLFGLDGCVTG